MTAVAVRMEAPPDCPCGGRTFVSVHTYTNPPVGETRFRFSNGLYLRCIEQCRTCGHYMSHHSMPTGDLYTGEYMDTTYGNQMRETYERIMALPNTMSDNTRRASRVRTFAAGRIGHRAGSILDVGSGLCVFLARMQQAGWEGTALDPDPRAVNHARSIGVAAVRGDYRTTHDLGVFDVVTFNKVLEHVKDPVGMLQLAHENVGEHGFVYVEVPDGETAAGEGYHRQEFHIAHHHAFTPESLSSVAGRAGFTVLRIDRLHEPSGKYTLAGFLA